MPTNDPTWLEQRITWDFYVVSGLGRMRYGTFNTDFYKQFCPGGIVLSALHPPRKVPERTYKNAKKISIEQR